MPLLYTYKAAFFKTAAGGSAALFVDFREIALVSCDYYKIIALCYKLRNNFVTKRKQRHADLICREKSVIMPAGKQEKE